MLSTTAGEADIAKQVILEVGWPPARMSGGVHEGAVVGGFVGDERVRTASRRWNLEVGKLEVANTQRLE